MNNITLTLLTHNEEEKINFDWLKDCPRINEIIVVDDNSTDKSVEYVKKLASKNLKVSVFSRRLEGDFSAQRNFAVSKSTNSWILWLDPDEKPTKSLIDFVNKINLDKNEIYSFKRQDIFLEKILKHGETNSLNFKRLFNKKYGKFIGKVHENWDSSLPVVQKDLIIIHQSHQTLSSFLQKINLYSSLRAQELYDQKKPFRVFDLIFYPPSKFILNYYLRLGFLDSTQGIILALGMSFHSFLTRAKLWHLYQH